MTRHLIQGYFSPADRENLVAAGSDERPTHLILSPLTSLFTAALGRRYLS